MDLASIPASKLAILFWLTGVGCVGPCPPVSAKITAVLQVVVPFALNIDVMLCHSLVSIILKSLASMSNHCAR